VRPQTGWGRREMRRKSSNGGQAAGRQSGTNLQKRWAGSGMGRQSGTNLQMRDLLWERRRGTSREAEEGRVWALRLWSGEGAASVAWRAGQRRLTEIF
jgi:hypothetical protein